MCCFSRPVESVYGTRIFARLYEGRQWLSYSMSLSAKEELAMILPLPVKREGKGETVKFINLEKYPTFFEDLEKGFPRPHASRGVKSATVDTMSANAPLPVESVGSFDASFVPTIADFSRLDARFQLPAGVWDKLPAYKNYGFAVFKLKPGAKTVHPMAFSYRSTEAERLFFPTVHIHDGTVQSQAHFDHTLYLQPSVGRFPSKDWLMSPKGASHFMKLDRALGLIDPPQHIYKKGLHGTQPNGDTWVAWT